MEFLEFTKRATKTEDIIKQLSEVSEGIVAFDGLMLKLEMALSSRNLGLIGTPEGGIRLVPGPQQKVDCIGRLEGHSIVHREYFEPLCEFRNQPH